MTFALVCYLKNLHFNTGMENLLELFFSFEFMTCNCEKILIYVGILSVWGLQIKLKNYSYENIQSQSWNITMGRCKPENFTRGSITLKTTSKAEYFSPCDQNTLYHTSINFIFFSWIHMCFSLNYWFVCVNLYLLSSTVDLHHDWGLCFYIVSPDFWAFKRGFLGLSSWIGGYRGVIVNY